MNLSLDLSPELEARLRETATRAGLKPQVYAVKLLERQLTDISPANMSESDLLLEATRGLPESVWKRYHELVELRRAEQLSPSAHEELIELTSVVERAHTRRLEFVAELARRRGVGLREMMDELGLSTLDG
jgi:iron-sulfur cluster repair protein YtfE (RIC family)